MRSSDCLPRTAVSYNARAVNHTLYNILTTLAVPPTAAYVSLRARHRPLLARFAPRVPRCDAPPLWVHACSVGELSVARPIVAALRERHPGLPVVLTVSTTSAWPMAEADPAGAALAWFPVDHPSVVARFFDRLTPRALVLVETEIWPNILRAAERRGVPVAVVNARLSDKHYARYRRHGEFFRDTFGRITVVAAQHQTYADRFASLGVDAARISITGNVKFDNVATDVPEEKKRALRAECGLEGRGPVIVFGSTRPGDEALAAACWKSWKEQFPCARLVVAPRHAKRLAEARAPFDGPVLLRSDILAGQRPAGERVLLVDTLGELVAFYALATVAIVGGSFCPGVNGHNPLEPAALGVPTVFGPYMSNFIDPAEVLVAARAAVQTTGPTELEHAVASLLRDDARRGTLSGNARDAIARNRGALARTLDIIDDTVKLA